LTCLWRIAEWNSLEQDFNEDWLAPSLQSVDFNSEI
jgi:hypothetical protein